MQCILYKIYFWKGFSYVLQIDMHLICTPMLVKFYSCKKWVLQPVSIGQFGYRCDSCELVALGYSWVTEVKCHA
jgi:hypothetical protein